MKQPFIHNPSLATDRWPQPVCAWPIKDGGGSDTTTLTKPQTRTMSEIDPPWNVVIYNDPVNLMSYVTFVIRRVFGYGKSKARRMMLEVHERGRSVVWTGNRERAEMYVEKLQSHQLLAGLEKPGE